MVSPQRRMAARLLVAATVLLCAPAAHASSVAISGGALTYQGGPEANRVTVTATGPGSFSVRDEGGVLVGSALQGCVGLGTVTCSGNVGSVVVLLGDGDDIAAVNTPASARGNVSGEGGNDVLYVGDGTAAFGGPGGDSLICSGGGLGCALDGGDGPDLLLGGAQTDALTGGPGKDRLDGFGGHDGLVAGPGDDVVRAIDNTPETVFCDEGSDTVAGDAEDGTYDCESASFTLQAIVRSARSAVAKAKVTRKGNRLRLTTTTRVAQSAGGTRVPCGGGKVRFRALVGKRVASKRSAKVSNTCSAKTTLRVRLKRSESRVRKLKLSADYLGNGWLSARKGRTVAVRVPRLKKG